MATGVLPVAIGEATKTVAFMMDAPKRYRFGVRWGEQRDTDDAEGTVIETSQSRPAGSTVANVLPRFIGRIEQVPPAYSALKVGGERAYALARQGRPPQLAPRTVHVMSLTLTEADDDGAAFVVECGKGTYVQGAGPRHRARRRNGGLRELAAPPLRSGRSPKRMRNHWINWSRSGIVWPSPKACFRSTRRWPTSRHCP